MAELCIPTTAIWPDPSVLVPPDDLDSDGLAAFDQRIEIVTARAWMLFQALTAYQLQLCPVTVRPCRGWGRGGSYFIAPVTGPAGSPFWPFFINGGAINILCGHDYECGCAWVHGIYLPGPVGAIDNVTIDGVVLDPSAYRLDNGNQLVRQDGEGWPYWQDFNLPLPEVGTFSVTYFNGASPDILVNAAVGILAQEYLDLAASGHCRLPAGLTQISRQGITMEVNADILSDGLTGIREVDDVTALFNPNRNKMPSAIYSLDRPVRTTPTPV